MTWSVITSTTVRNQPNLRLILPFSNFQMRKNYFLQVMSASFICTLLLLKSKSVIFKGESIKKLGRLSKLLSSKLDKKVSVISRYTAFYLDLKTYLP